MTDAPALAPTAPEQLTVMSLNIRCDRSPDGGTRPGDPDHWPERRPLLIELLARERPALLGIQEALDGQLGAIEEALPGHRRLGVGREGGRRGEHCALVVDAERFEVLSWDQFWLSDTPAVIGSATWGHSIPRIVVRARLHDRATGRVLTALNTHFDHESETARRRSARMLADLVAELRADGSPVVLTGDLNAAAHRSAAHRILVTDGPLVDAWDAAAERRTPAWGTFPDYGPPIEGGERIDWILTSPDVAVPQAAITVPAGEGRSPSDHAAVQALLVLP